MSITEEKTVKGVLFKICCLIALIVFAVLALLPLIWALLSGFKSQSEFYSIPPTFLPTEWNWSNFTELFTVYKIQNYILNSIIVIGGSLIISFYLSQTIYNSIIRIFKNSCIFIGINCNNCSATLYPTGMMYCP